MKKITTTIVLSIILAFALVTLGMRLFGYQTYVVVSDSMYPSIPKNSFVYVKTITADNVKESINEGDVIAMDVGVNPLMHRVIEKRDTTVITHGDANSENDTEEVSYENVIGIVIFHLPLIGLLFRSYMPWLIMALLILGYVITKKLVKEIRKG